MKKPDLLDRLFRVGIILKGLDGLLEIIGGLALFFVSPAALNRLAIGLTAHELSQDPHDFIARHLLRSAAKLNGHAVVFGALYLLSHGLVKIVLVGALLKNKLWAYPWMIVFLLLFIVYQLYRLTIEPTFGLSVLTIFDAIIAWLTWREYQKRVKIDQPHS